MFIRVVEIVLQCFDLNLQTLEMSHKDNFLPRLVDNSEPLSCASLLAMLDAEKIQHKTVEHAPMRTVEDAKAIRSPSPYGHTKNLFVRNKKGQMWLLTLHEDRQVDLKSLGVSISAGRLSFGSPQRLMHYLGVLPGAVSMFSALNDVTHAVTCYIDESLMQAPELHLHPLVNTQTTTINRIALLDFLARRGHKFNKLRFDGIQTCLDSPS